MITTVQEMGTNWIEIVNGTDYLIQVRGTTAVELVVSDILPAAQADGILLRPFDVITHQMVSGRIWVRGNSTSKNSLVSVTV